MFFFFFFIICHQKAWKLEHKKLCTGISPGGLSCHSYWECGVERGLNHCSPPISPSFHCALPRKFVCNVRHLSKISWMVRKKKYVPPPPPRSGFLILNLFCYLYSRSFKPLQSYSLYRYVYIFKIKTR